MNVVAISGNLTRDPEVRYTNNNMAIASFSIAINRPPKKDGTEGGADFPRVTVFGNQAENCGRFLKRGSKVIVVGKIQTGSYEKDGQRIYTTDVIADRVEFLGRPAEANVAHDKDTNDYLNQQAANAAQTQSVVNFQNQQATNAWKEVDDDDIPF